MNKPLTTAQMVGILIVFGLIWLILPKNNKPAETSGEVQTTAGKKASTASTYIDDYNALGGVIKRQEKDVQEVVKHENSLGHDEPFETSLDIHMKFGTECSRGREVAQKYYPQLVAIRRKYLNESEAANVQVCIYDERGRGRTAFSNKGFEDTGCLGQ